MSFITEEDIEKVQASWKELHTCFDKLSHELAKLLIKKKNLNEQFKKHGINVSEQSNVILAMVGQAIEQLKDINTIIPWLKELGKKHKNMNIKPNILAQMKDVLIMTLSKGIGIEFENLKTHYNKIISFLIGIMIEGIKGEDDTSSVDTTTKGITNHIVQLVRNSWIHVESVSNTAMDTFYKELLSSEKVILISVSCVFLKKKHVIQAEESVLCHKTQTSQNIIVEVMKVATFINDC